MDGLELTVPGARLMLSTVNVPAGRWSGVLCVDHRGAVIHHGTPDQARHLTAWLQHPATPTEVGTLEPGDSLLTLTPQPGGHLLLTAAYALALSGGRRHLSRSRATLTADHGHRWATWLTAWLATVPNAQAPTEVGGQYALWP